jgi:hypothetical protein
VLTKEDLENILDQYVQSLSIHLKRDTLWHQSLSAMA